MKNAAKNDSLIREFLSCGDYRVDEEGRIFSFRNRQGWKQPFEREVILSNRKGYVFVSFRGKYLSVHRIVYQARIGELNSEKVINHLDGNPSNNHPSNLELTTQSHNMTHSFRVLNRKPVIANVKLTRSQVNRMRMLRGQGWSYGQLVKEFDTAKSNVASIVKMKSWKQTAD